MKNIELKVRVNNFSGILPILRKRLKYAGLLKQKDTYYLCRQGRIKIREINNNQFILIYYRRPNTSRSKLSDYQIVPISKRQLNPMTKLFTSVLGKKIIVTKTRQLWRIGTTRIHLDRVKGLGKFLELETVLGSNGYRKALTEHRKIINVLKLGKYRQISRSYSDL